MFDMLKCLLELRSFCETTQNEKGFESLKKSSSMWEKIAELKEVLEILAQVTTILQKEDLIITDFIDYEFRKNSLVWWKENTKQFPALSAVALDIISAPVTSFCRAIVFTPEIYSEQTSLTNEM